MTIKQIKTAYDAINQVFYAKNQNYAEKLLTVCKAEEKRHRSGDFYKYHPNCPSVADMAKLFSVRRVCEYLLDRDAMPRVIEYNHCHESCFIAAGIVGEFAPEIESALLEKFNQDEIKQLASLDYCDYVKAQ